MKKTLLIFVFLLIGTIVTAQEKKETLDITIQVSNLQKTERKINEFLSDNKLELTSFSSKYEILSYKIFFSEQENYSNFYHLIKSLGYVTSQTKTIIDTTEIEDGYRFQNHLIQTGYQFGVRLNIKEEPSAGSYYDENWINMPGIEYSYLNTENAIDGVTPESMSGISLKYLFNTTKSYGVLGIYKSNDEKNDEEVSEIYTFAFGQDFYSRKLGRGKRQFLNPYTSVNLGASVSSSEIDKTFTWFMNPYVGVELIKNKYMLLDTKVGYFLPYKGNRNQRGLLINASLNIIF